MSHAPWSISTVLDWLQAYGETPTVNPARMRDGILPPLDIPPHGMAHALLWALLTLLALLIILLVVMFGPETGGFIYEQF